MHDRNGKLIEVGDEVVLKGKVVGTAATDGSFCSVNVEIEGDWDGKGNTTKMWFAAKQVFVVAKVPDDPRKLVQVTQDGE